MNKKTTRYQSEIDIKVRKIIFACSSLIILYNIVFLFIDNDREIYHLLILGIFAVLNIIILYKNYQIKNVKTSALYYLIVNNFIFLPYVFLNGRGFEGFIPYFAIISCAIPFYIQRDEKGILSAGLTSFVFSVFSISYLFMKIDVIDKNAIYQCISFIIAMIFIVIFSRHFTIMYMSSLKQLRHIATNDGLTNVRTRRYLIDEVILPRESAIIKSGGFFSFIITDIDNFKEINDMYGHKYGDFALSTIASTISCLIRQTDEVARFGGDEFMVYLDNVGVKDSRDIAERIRETIERIEIEGGIKTTVSMGVVTVVKEHTSGYLRMADLCLMQAKEQGRNRVVSYEIDFDKSIRSKYESM